MIDICKHIFARFARAILIFVHYEATLTLFMTSNHLLYSCVDDKSPWPQKVIIIFLPSPIHPNQIITSRIISPHDLK